MSHVNVAPSIKKLEKLCGKLNRLSGLSQGLIDAFDEGNENNVIECVYESRQARAELDYVQREVSAMQLGTSVQEIELLAQATEFMEMVNIGGEIVDRWLERELPADEVMLGSELGRVFLADAMLPPVWDYKRDLVVLVGNGLGPLAKKLVSVEQKRILLLLPEGSADDYPDEVVRIRSIDEIVYVVSKFHSEQPRRIATRMLPLEEFEDGIQGKVVKRAHEVLTDMRVHRNTVVTFAKKWMEQGIANLVPVASCPSIETVGDAFAGKPMLIVAPGPSLKGNIEEVKRIRDKVLLMAFSHSLAPLTRAGIVPDFVLSVDPQDVRYHFDGSDMSQVVAVINGVTVHPSLYHLSCPQAISVAANADLEEWVFGAFGESAQAPGGGSVATSALSLAARWKCSPIIFCGLDLSFPEGKMYIDSSVDGETQVMTDDSGLVSTKGWSSGRDEMKSGEEIPVGVQVQKGVKLPGYYGGLVQSDTMFSMFHRWFEGTCRQNPDIRAVNCTEGGAFIDGMEHRPLSEMTAELDAVVSARELLAESLKEIDIPGRQKTMIAWLNGLLQGVDTCLSLANRCVRLADNFTKNDHAALQRYEVLLIEAVAPLKFVSMLAQPEIERALLKARHSESLNESLEASRSIFKTVIETAKWVRPLLQSAVRELQVASELTAK